MKDKVWVERVLGEVTKCRGMSSADEVEGVLKPILFEGYHQLQRLGYMDSRDVQETFDYLDRMSFRIFPFVVKILQDLAHHARVGSLKDSLLQASAQVEEIEALVS